MLSARLAEGRRRDAVLIAGALFAAIFILRVTVGSVSDALSFLYILPVVAVAVALGMRAGLAAGAERLRALESESARHFNLSRDMICIAGFDGFFKRVNPAFEQTLGFTEAELLGRPFIDFVHPDDRRRTEEEAAAIGDGGGTVQFQNRYIDKQGEVHWIEWTSVGILEEDQIYAIARDVTDRKAIEVELERLSHHDPLTGLLNRRSFDEVLEWQLDYTRHYGWGGAILIVDLDRFKQINDELGHAAGDAALCEVARVLSANLHPSDTIGPDSSGVVARLGGDEFALLLPEADAAGAEAVAQRLVAALAESRLTIDGTELRLAISVGAALFDQDGCPPAKELMAAADRAMYLAKAAGGGGAVLADLSAGRAPQESVDRLLDGLL
ncbi:MAG TPA: diguanylate cyclase [Solirubrobacterales bacterium]